MNPDINHIYSNAQTITGSAAVDSSNVVQQASGAQGVEKEFVDVYVQTPFTGLTALTVSISECATPTGTYTTLVTSKAIPVAALVKSKDPVFKFLLPPNHLPWTKITYTPTGTGTAGAITAYLTPQDF
jgi:hypothetical protein